MWVVLEAILDITGDFKDCDNMKRLKNILR